jgi:hypothetical protein
MEKLPDLFRLREEDHIDHTVRQRLADGMVRVVVAGVHRMTVAGGHQGGHPRIQDRHTESVEIVRHL